MGPRILAATGGEKIILSGHRQRLTEIEVAVISYELRSLDLCSFVRLNFTADFKTTLKIKIGFFKLRFCFSFLAFKNV